MVTAAYCWRVIISSYLRAMQRCSTGAIRSGKLTRKPSCR